MRTFTGAQAARFASGNFSIASKVEIDRTGSGSWVDVSSLQGRDWVREIVVKDSVDDASMTASLKLQRSQYYLSLAPLMATSQLNVGGTLVTIARKIRIWVYIAPYGKAKASEVPSGGWTLLFSGRIFSVDWAGDEIAVEARDLGGDMMDAFISEIVTYGSDTGVLAETVMQQLITARAAGSFNTLPSPATPYTLYSINGTSGTPWNVADSPGWAIKTYKQDEMPLWAAISLIAQQIGWVLKFRYNSSVGDFVLTWHDPARSNTTPAYTFSAKYYAALTECSLHLGDIRNLIRGTYYDTAGQLQTYTNSDPVSKAAYGDAYRYMKFAEEATSQVNTLTEMTKMVDGALSDLAQPTMTHSVEMPGIFWPAQICDVYKFTANNVHYDSDQTLALTGYQHTIGVNKSSTTLSLRGKPSAGVRTWFERQSKNVRKQFGFANWQVSSDETNQIPNGTFTQYTKG